MNESMLRAATGPEITNHFFAIPPTTRHSGNWGCDMREPGQRSIWDIQPTSTYINGIMLTLDCDYIIGYLLEICDRVGDETYVKHIGLFTGPHRTTQAWHPHTAYPFFSMKDTDVTHASLYHWMVDWFEARISEELRG